MGRPQRRCADHPHGDEPMYSWEIATGDADRGVCGVAFPKARAVARVAEGLRMCGGVSGTVRACHLGDGCYSYGDVLARAELDAVSGAVVWGDG